jgi:hypothetical protein
MKGVTIMKKRNIFALTMATVMAVGTPLTAMAAVGTASDAGTANTVTGEVEYVDTEIYSVTVPTDAGISNLYLDPQGLLVGLTEDGSKTAEELATYAGQITSSGKPQLINKSSKDMAVTATFKVEGDATCVATEADVEKDATTDNNVLLYVVPSKTNTKGDEDNYTAQKSAIPLGTTDTAIKFVLGAADYTFKNDSGTITYELAAEENGNSTALYIGGALNKNADWSDYSSENTGDTASKFVKLTATYSFDKVSTEKATNNDTIYGLDQTDLTPITLAEYPSALQKKASVADSSLTYNGKDEISTTVNFGVPETTIDSIVFNYQTYTSTKDTTLKDNQQKLTTSNYTLSGNTLSFKSSCFTKLGATLSNTVATSGTIVITFKNGNTAEIAVTYQAD